MCFACICILCDFAFMYVCVRLHETEKGKWEGIKQFKVQPFEEYGRTEN